MFHFLLKCFFIAIYLRRENNTFSIYVWLSALILLAQPHSLQRNTVPSHEAIVSLLDDSYTFYQNDKKII